MASLTLGALLKIKYISFVYEQVYMHVPHAIRKCVGGRSIKIGGNPLSFRAMGESNKSIKHGA